MMILQYVCSVFDRRFVFYISLLCLLHSSEAQKCSRVNNLNSDGSQKLQGSERRQGPRSLRGDAAQQFISPPTCVRASSLET